MKRLNYKHLYYFWVVAKEGTIAKASQILHLTPPTLSAQINTLEEMLAVKLFKKSGRQLVLTEIGKITHEYAESIFLLGMELENFISNDQHQRQIQFKIGITEVMPKLIVYRLINPAFQLSKDIRIVCREDNFESLLTDLAAHKLDLILADRQINPSLNIKAYNHLLGSCGITLFANIQLASTLSANFPSSLHRQPFLLPTLDTVLRRAIDQWFDELDITPYIVGEFADSALLKVFGQEGKGIFFAPTVIENEILRQYEVTVLGRTEAIREQFFAITAERRIKHPAVSHIREMALSTIFNQAG